MAGPIISKLLTDFFNEIGPLRHLMRCNKSLNALQQYVCNRGISGSGRLAAETTLMTRVRHWQAIRYPVIG